MYLNDSEMELSGRKAEKFEMNFQSYREGASGANGGKTGHNRPFFQYVVGIFTTIRYHALWCEETQAR